MARAGGDRAEAGGSEPRRKIPSVDALLRSEPGRRASATFGRPLMKHALTSVLAEARGAAVRGVVPPGEDAARAARAYTDLEVDRTTGARGKRTSRAERLLVALTGAEDALVVNNGAAALLLALAALARGKQVLVSRGELIEIGGEFRIPDILAASGAKLVEVGTTNRTRVADYRGALTERTALVLKVHPSNYRVVGFTAAPSASELAGVA